MTREERNRLITEAMGGCWHEGSVDKYQLGYDLCYQFCTKCGKALLFRSNPNWHSDANFLPLLRWARDQEWFGTFMSETCRKKHKDNDTYCSMTNEKITGLVRGPVHCRVMARREGE